MLRGCLFSGVFSVIGFVIGLFNNGIWGAILGALLGGLVDGLFSSVRVKSSRKTYYRTHDFTEHELVLAAYVAKADNNRLLRSEMEYVRRFLLQNMGPERTQAAMLRFRDILNADVDIQSVCEEIRKYANLSEKLIILQFLFGFSNADGSMDAAEVEAIHEISNLCGISESAFESMWAMFSGQSQFGGYTYDYDDGSARTSRAQSVSDNDYKILEVSPTATNDEVKKAYRAAAKKHHPDKVGHLGEDVRKAAEVKFAQVNEAYERIKRSRGMN